MPKPKIKTPRRPAVTRRDFIGAQMSNLLHAIKQDVAVSQEFRKSAADLQEKWDTVAVFSLNNPLVAADMQSDFDSGQMKP